MRHAKFSPSHFQMEIRSGLLSKEEIKLGLQNKCLNEHYLYDPEISSKLLVIGGDINRHAEAIDRLVDKALNFSQFVHSDEIILLERIRANLRRYDFGEAAVGKDPAASIGGVRYLPVVPNISYRLENFSELYSLYLQLQKQIFNHFRYVDRNTAIHNIQYLFGAGNYKECIAYSRKSLSFLPNDQVLVWNYIALCLYKLGAKDAAYQELYYIYKDRPYTGNLVSSRSFLGSLISDRKVVDILLMNHSTDELAQLNNTLEHERASRKNFLQENGSLLAYFEKKRTLA